MSKKYFFVSVLLVAIITFLIVKDRIQDNIIEEIITNKNNLCSIDVETEIGVCLSETDANKIVDNLY
jgi:hypothetical protein